MTDRDFDRALAGAVGDLPPREPTNFTPWSGPMRKILWGMGLSAFMLELWYLQYLLPLLGQVFLLLGLRGLGKTHRCFVLARGVALLLLASRLLALAVGATRLSPCFAAGPLFWLWGLVGLLLNLLLLLLLRQGIRKCFLSLAGEPPRDWLGLGIAAWLGCAGRSLWGTLDPAAGGSTLLLWLRFLGAAALYGALLLLLRRQLAALAGRGYQIVPAPVRCRDRTAIVLVFLLAALLVVPGMIWGTRTPLPEAETAQPAEADLEAVRSRLTDLGMPEALAADLSEEDLRLCESAVAVHDSSDCLLNGDPVAPQELGGGTIELRSWTVVLADQSLRFFHTFRWLEPPTLSIQEAIYADPDGNQLSSTLTARLTWSRDGERLAADLPVELAGGQRAEELTEEQLWWYKEELNRLGHLQYQPYALFSLPAGGEDVRGYLAYSRPAEAENYQSSTIFGGWYYVRQSAPQYPYQSVEAYIRGKSGQLLSFGAPPFSQAGIAYATHVWFQN